ncbi:MAG: hypothetical protein ABI402_06800 [Ferruginibacter sp.]
MIFVANGAFCQFSPKKIVYTTINKKDSLLEVPFFSNNYFLTGIIPSNFSTTQLGFFCKKEWKFESATKLPFKFRLGNVQYCDWLEGKKGSGILPVR